MWLTRHRHRLARKRYARHPFPDANLEYLLDKPWPDSDRRWDEASWLALDLETTGLDPEKDYIVSMGWVAIEGGSIQLSTARHLLIDSRNLVGDSAIIHHIRDVDLDEGVPLQEALRQLARALAGRFTLMHHRPFDDSFLRATFREQFGMNWVQPGADTLTLEKKRLFKRDHLLPRGALKLARCRRRYGLPDYLAHNALDDALATAELFIAWARHYGGNGPRVRHCLQSGFTSGP